MESGLGDASRGGSDGERIGLVGQLGSKDMNENLVKLRSRLVEAQHRLLLQAAQTETLPSDSALRRIADLESAILATDALIDEHKTSPNRNTSGQ